MKDMNTDLAEVRPLLNTDRIDLGASIPLGAPLIMYVETSGFCNLKCKFCPHYTSPEDLIKNNMSLDLFEKLVSDMQSFPNKVELLRYCGTGENLLNKKIDIANLKTHITNKKINQSVDGNTSTVYINPLNALRFVLNELKKDKINLNKDFYIFTGSTVGVVPILGKGLYTGKIESLGSAKAIIN